MEISERLLQFIITVIQCIVVYSCKEGSIKDLSNLDLRGPDIVSDYWTDGQGILVTDDELQSGWYRTVHNGWQYTMSDKDSMPDYTTCSTYWPIYLNDSHPPTDNLGEDPVDVKACIRDDLSPCSTSYNIQIRKCNDEIQYHLTHTAWYSAYCFKQSVQLKEEIAPAPQNVNFGNVVVLPELKFSSEPVDRRIWYIPYIAFRCHFDVQKELYYSVDWYIDKTPFKETLGPTKNLDELALLETNIISSQIILPFQLRCGVSASSEHDGLKTSETFSPLFYAGMKILNSSLLLDKGGAATVKMVSTIPIGCRYFKLPNGRIPDKACKTEMKLFVNKGNPLSCTNQRGSILNQVKPDLGFENQMCAKYINTLNEEDKWQPDTQYNFTVVTSDHTYEDDSEFVLKLQMGDNGHRLWDNYLFPDIRIFIQNMELYKRKICKARNDPHMYTFDGYNYEQQDEGTFILYNNTKYGIEVQHMVKQCNEFATCTCGVAVSAGQDIFMINRCGNVPFIGFTQCGDGGILDVVRVHDLLYRVFTPIGSRVEISLSSTWMNVDIYMAPKDMKNAVGLCGYADGDKTNDLRHRNSNKVSPLGAFNVWKVIHQEFIATWKVGDDNENLFKPTFKKRPKWSQQNGLYCVCNSRKRVDRALCSSTQYLDCTKSGSVTKTKCHVKSRRKRSVGNHSDKEIRRLLAKMQPSFTRKKRALPKLVVITDEATAFCGERINGSLALNEFKNVSANDDKGVVTSWCSFDLSADNDTIWADVHVEAINDGVKNMMDLQPTYVETNPEKVEVFLKNTCPMNCTGRGNCSDSGVCSCFTYYHGPDCSIDERDALEISDIQGGGECDVAEGDECECFYVRSDRIQENFTCSVTTSKIPIKGDTVNISSDIIKGGFEDIFTGICCVPVNIRGQEDVFVAKYGVQISNNGYNFGKVENVYVYDSNCQEVNDTEDGDKTFSLKENRCFVQGFCFADNDMAPSGCMACVSSSALYNWTEYNPCKNGGNCTGEENGYSCSCVDGYGGINCEYEINECDSSPCLNGGNCTDKFNAYMCECAAGFTGNNCETDINECASQPCQNGGLCTDQVNMYNCTCVPGFEGVHCETETNECESSPCQNGGTCSDKVNQYECTCKEGFYGVNCQTKINNCESNPCLNGATCTDLDNGRLCTCLVGFEGRNCEININDCRSNPCQNGGHCADLVNGFSCTCVEGFEGSKCEINIDDCSSDPCQNGGSCVDSVNAFKCTCVGGFRGIYCEKDIDECSSGPCQNGGVCTNLVNGFNCTCVDGFEGTECEIDIDDCVTNPCQNDGNCTDVVNGFTCSCANGFEGEKCEININDCSPNPCHNGGMCKDLVNGFMCTCTEGYEGFQCDINIDDCASNPCQNGGNCTDFINGFSCFCANGFEGEMCEIDINDCISNPCHNGGICKDLVNGFTCTCAEGFEGYQCEINIDDCVSNPCQNDGNCTDVVNGFTCLCANGFEGENCEINIDDCVSNPCQNGGNCTDVVNGFTCSCANEFEGETCEININDCSPNPCHNGGICNDLLNGFTCTCADGYEGYQCDINIDDCVSNPCQNGGNCTDVVKGFSCLCANGFEGETCEININDCSPNPCHNGGLCKDLVNEFTCSCAEGYEGYQCDINIDDCVSNPCQNGGNCTDVVNGFTCSCAKGFEGETCEININDCSPNPCHNGGMCKDLVNEFTCTCADGYEGYQCDINIDDCVSNPCQNGGNCTDVVNGFTCSCANGFEGETCEININECRPTSCQNGGSCVDLVNGFTCTCSEGFEGSACEISTTSTITSTLSTETKIVTDDVNNCSPNPCKNGGSCEDLLVGFTCTCTEAFEGIICEISTTDSTMSTEFTTPSKDINNCLPNPCQNGGSCVGLQDEFTCTCTEGFEGAHCEIRIDTPDSVPTESTMITNVTTIRLDVTPRTKINVIVMVFNVIQLVYDLKDPDFIAEIENVLTRIYKKRLDKKLKGLRVISLRSGSLVVNYEIEYEDSETATREFLMSVIDLTSGKHEIVLVNESVSALSATINDVNVTRDMLEKTASVCELFVTLNGKCGDGRYCIFDDGGPYCVETEVSEENHIMIIASSCAGGVLLLAVVIISVFVWRYRRRTLSYNQATVTRKELGKKDFPMVEELHAVLDTDERFCKTQLLTYKTGKSAQTETTSFNEKQQEIEDDSKDAEQTLLMEGITHDEQIQPSLEHQQLQEL